MYALIKAGIVEKIIIADSAFADSISADWDYVVTAQDTTRIGDTYQGSEFAHQEQEPAQAVTLPKVLVKSLPMASARKVLLSAGLLSRVESAINSLPSQDKEYAKLDWEYSSNVERGSALVTNLGKALGLTEAQIDDLFTAGAAL